MQFIEYTTIGLRLSGHGAAEVDVNLTEELTHTETDPTCEIHESYLHVTLKFGTKILRPVNDSTKWPVDTAFAPFRMRLAKNAQSDIQQVREAPL